MHKETQALREHVDLAISKERKDGPSSSVSVAISEDGKRYYGGSVDSDTNLLDISSEQVALLLSIGASDFKIEHVVTLLKDASRFKQTLSPLTIKVLVDYAIRVGRKISYTIINDSGETLFETTDVTTLTPYYQPESALLSKVATAEQSTPLPPLKTNPLDLVVLKQVAKDAITKNFPTYDSASGYGAAVVTSEGNIFSSGQYSSFEKRLNIHAEMGAVLNSLMHQRKNIIALALVSSKFKDVPCEICGCCRQFLSEMSSRFNLNLTYYCFALETDAYKTYTLEELLPSPWSSLKK